MKKILCLLLAIAVAAITFAQTQQGIVKTRGRVVNGQVVPGKRLSGATVTLNFGNPLVSGNQGVFSFNVPTAKIYALVSATKQGYTLADPEYVRRTFSYSAENPFYVVLEDEQQRQADIKEATDKVRRTLKRELRQREDELDELRESNAISQARYDSLRMEFATYRQNSENLVNKMAERYASTDYDQLDEFNRQVQMNIEEGELQKADSMIRSKGNMEQRVAEYHNVVAANNAKREQLKQERRDLEQSEKGATKAYEDLSQDLLRRSEIFLQAYKQDSALYCLKLRADLDTTNIVAVREYADLCSKQKKFEDCERYWHICLRSYLRNNDEVNTATIYNNLGTMYRDLRSFDKSKAYLGSALGIIEKLFEADPEAYRLNLSNIYNNLGVLYFDLQDNANCEKYYKLALDNKEILFKQNPETYRYELAKTQENLGALYNRMRDYANCEIYNKRALENAEILFSQNPEMYRSFLTDVQNNLGALFSDIKDYESCEKFYKKAFENLNILFSQNPDAYRELLTFTLCNLGNLYYYIRDFSNSEKYFKSSLYHFEILNKQHSSFRIEMLMVQNNLGALYKELHDYANCEKYYLLALGSIEHLFNQNNEVYRPNLAMFQFNVGNLYREMKDYAKSEKYFNQAIENYELLSTQYPNAYTLGLALCNNSIAYLYSDERMYTKAIEYVDKSISLCPTIDVFYDTKGEILLMQDKKEEALDVWKKLIELNPEFLNQNPEGTTFSNGLKSLGLI